jgi:hypothetical protein
MRSRPTVIFIVGTLLYASHAPAGSPLMVTAPGSSGSCGTPGVTICTPGADLFTNFPPTPPSVYTAITIPLVAGDAINSLSRALGTFSGTSHVILFSVDAASVGAGGDVLTQASTGEAGADIYSGGTIGAPAVNVLVADGDGLPSAAPPAIGFVEPSGGGVAPFDDLNGLVSCSTLPGPFGIPLALFTLAPGSPSLTSLGATPSDILGSLAGQIEVVVTGASRGFLAGDVIDALVVGGASGSEELLVSLAPGSPTLALLGAGPEDLLVSTPSASPALAISGASLGLAVGDNLDAVDLLNDADGDLVHDECDNCPNAANNDQANNDGDASGNACDTCTDGDFDGFGDPGFPASTCPDDNCPLISNPTQSDTDLDGVGDHCDQCPTGDDNFDADGDFVPDDCDTCPGFDDADPTNPCNKLYSIARDNDQFRLVNPFSGKTLNSVTITLAGEVVQGGTALATQPSTGALWAALTLAGQSSRQLVRIDPLTGVAADVGDLGDDFAGLAFDCDGNLYGLTDDDAFSLIPESLYRLDQSDATPTLFRTLGNGGSGEALAFNATDGLMYHLSGTDSSAVFETIHLPTLSIANIPLLGTSFISSVKAFTYWEAQDLFLITAGSGGSFDFHRITAGGVVISTPFPGGRVDHRSHGLAFTEPSASCAQAGNCPASPVGTCAVAGKSSLQIRDRGDIGPSQGDKLILKWLNGPAALQSDFGNPVDNSGDYTLCLYTGLFQDLAMEAQVTFGGACGGNDCWRTIGAKGYRYTNAAGTVDGIVGVLVKGSETDKSKIIIKGRHQLLPLPDLPIANTADAIVQLFNSDNTNCWESTFPPTSIRKSTSTIFKAKIP